LPAPPSVPEKKSWFERLPEEKRSEIERLWFDASIASNAEVARIVGYTVDNIKNVLGASGRANITPNRAREMQAASTKVRRGNRMPEEDARLVWGNLKLSDDACVAETGWPRATAFAGFAKGGRKKLAEQIAAESKAARKRKTKR
jgi:hypothetical protein